MKNNKFVTTLGIDVTLEYFKDDKELLDNFSVRRDCYTVLETGEKITFDLITLKRIEPEATIWKPVVAIVKGVRKPKSFMITEPGDIEKAYRDWVSRLDYLVEHIWNNSLE